MLQTILHCRPLSYFFQITKINSKTTSPTISNCNNLTHIVHSNNNFKQFTIHFPPIILSLQVLTIFFSNILNTFYNLLIPKTFPRYNPATLSTIYEYFTCKIISAQLFASFFLLLLTTTTLCSRFIT